METAQVTLPQSIFRAYDIRGVVGKTLTAEGVYLVGKSLGSEIVEQGGKEVVVGRDGRLSGPKLISSLIDGLKSTGLKVYDLGRVPTPVVYFATHTMSATSGVVLTGSHNPQDHNGLKMVINQKALSGEAIQGLYQRIEENRFVEGEGTVERYDLLPEYISRITTTTTLKRPLKVVVDCGNGIAGLVAPMLLRELGCKVHELYCEVDGHFPNHHPDPSDPNNLQDLIQMVAQKGADIGLAFDGDGDRLGVVTAEGDVIWPDRQLILYAVHILKENPGAKIIYDVKSTRHVGTVVSQHGGVPIMSCTGHSLVKARIREENAAIGGEMSGHMFFNDRWYGFDDAIYTAARLLEILASTERTPEEVFSDIPESISTPELKIPVTDESKFEMVQKLIEMAKFDDPHQVNTIDGLRVDFTDGWGLVRASNTTAILVVRFEADDEKALKRIQKQFKACLLAVDSSMALPF